MSTDFGQSVDWFRNTHFPVFGTSNLCSYIIYWEQSRRFYGPEGILLLGNPKLFEIAREVRQDELAEAQKIVEDLHDTLIAFRRQHGCGRGIAAPQIGIPLRIVYACLDAPIVMINPVLSNLSDEIVEVWDDCMSFPSIIVKLRRHRTCTITYRDLDWIKQSMDLDGDLSELFQHEVDHLDGILAIMRVIDPKYIIYKSQRHLVAELAE